MVITLLPKLEILLQHQVEIGHYEDEIDALFAGMNLCFNNRKSSIDEVSQPELDREVIVDGSYLES